MIKCERNEKTNQVVWENFSVHFQAPQGEKKANKKSGV
jgi:hypothetical protein